ncbi:DUF2911 domain-containing protein [Chryseolinea sp. T2]|uniref:DUF2911 domain-containing protein n=1 Tax=Chryseolinea sp. T2 TaxID=3129255 RepID=UPI0030776B81
MQHLRYLHRIMLFCFISASAAHAQDQDETPRPSTFAQASIRFKETYVKVTYSQPNKGGREIFGNVVPYGKVWRTGANEATEITTTKNITLNGFLLKAGTYSIFTIPGPDSWTILINSELGLWGAYNHNPRLDILKFHVPAAKSSNVHERFTIEFAQRNESADLSLMWDDVKVIVPVKFLN